eukprot:Lithocolla_globosa_v1_NODE_799_length_3265_cov_5.501246.p5 type:complete len:107 gc:universal NODE_799_length_3265_cov_5.501246:491-171(-)
MSWNSSHPHWNCDTGCGRGCPRADGKNCQPWKKDEFRRSVRNNFFKDCPVKVETWAKRCFARTSPNNVENFDYFERIEFAFTVEEWQLVRGEYTSLIRARYGASPN